MEVSATVKGVVGVVTVHSAHYGKVCETQVIFA